MVARKLMDDHELAQLLREGHTHAEIAEINRERTGQPVSPRSVSVKAVELADRGMVPHRLDRHKDLIPWTIRASHRDRGIRRSLLMEARQRKEKKLSEDDRSQLESLKAEMKMPGETANTSDITDWVIHYEPRSEAGFWLVPRRPEDEDMIRVPDEDHLELCRRISRGEARASNRQLS